MVNMTAPPPSHRRPPPPEGSDEVPDWDDDGGAPVNQPERITGDEQQAIEEDAMDAADYR